MSEHMVARLRGDLASLVVEQQRLHAELQRMQAELASLDLMVEDIKGLLRRYAEDQLSPAAHPAKLRLVAAPAALAALLLFFGIAPTSLEPQRGAQWPAQVRWARRKTEAAVEDGQFALGTQGLR